MIVENSPDSEILWDELVPSEHLVQIYEDDEVFLGALVDFVAAGLRAGEAAIVIATSRHLNALEQRLYALGLNLNLAITQDQYLPFDASELLSQFVVDGWPNEERFEQAVTQILSRASRDGRQVRAFGEMVALMWQRGSQLGTIRLEELWNELRRKNPFPLFCAYPKNGFSGDARKSVQCICDTHSRVISGRRTQQLSVASAQ